MSWGRGHDYWSFVIGQDYQLHPFNTYLKKLPVGERLLIGRPEIHLGADGHDYWLFVIGQDHLSFLLFPAPELNE